MQSQVQDGFRLPALSGLASGSQNQATKKQKQASVAAFECIAASGLLRWSGDVESVLGVPKGAAPRTLEEYIGLVHSDQRAVVCQRITNAEHGSTFEVLHSLEGGRDAERRIRCLGSIPRYDAGNSARIHCMIEDVTAREADLERLRTAEPQLRAIMRQAPDTIMVVAPDNRILSINRGLPGLEPEEMIGAPIWRCVPTEGHAKVREALRTAMEQRIEVCYEVTSDEGLSREYFQCRATPVVRGSETVAVAITSSNVTKLVEAQKKLDLLSGMAECCSDVIVIGNVDGPIRYFNQAGRELFGIRRDQDISDYAFHDFLDPGEAVRVARDFMPRILSDGHCSGNVELAGKRSDSKTILEFKAFLLSPPRSGEPGTFAAIARDVSQSQRLINELRRREEELQELTQHFERMLEASPAVLYKCKGTESFEFSFVGTNVNRLLGFEASDLVDNPELFLEHVDAEDRERVVGDARAWSGARTLTTVYRVRRRDGASCWIQDSRRISVDDETHRDVIVGSWQDVTALRLAQESLREQEALFRAVVQNTHDVITLMKDDGAVLYQSPSARKVMGRDPAAAVGRNVFRFMHPEDAARLQSAIAELGRNPDGAATLEVRSPHADGSLRTFETVVKLLPKEFGPNIALMTSRDVTERIAAEERRGRQEASLAHQACHDPLTGLANRKLFMERLTYAVESTKGGGAPFAVLYMDVDRFKQINDTLGHVDADHVLKAFVARVQVHMRRADLFARLGGDEFGAVVRGFENRSDVVAIAQRIKDAGLLPLTLPSGKTVCCTASIGIVFGDEGVDNIPEIIKCADAAMYCAKSRGRAQFEVFAERMFEERACRMELRDELPRALENGDLHFEFQPCINLKTGEVTRCEALLRWRFGDLGLVPPDRVVEIAEESGMIDRIALWSIEQACRQIRRWDETGVAVPRVAVNLSAHNLTAGAVVERIPSLLRDAGVRAERLEIEISEEALFDLGPEARRRLEALCEMGVNVSVDNFGRGHSSLNHLRNLPAQTVKIDRTLVADLPVERPSTAVLRAIVVMAEALGLRVVGEGVETDEQLAILRREGCDEAQGFLFSRPRRPEQLASFIEERKGRQRAATA